MAGINNSSPSRFVLSVLANTNVNHNHTAEKIIDKTTPPDVMNEPVNKYIKPKPENNQIKIVFADIGLVASPSFERNVNSISKNEASNDVGILNRCNFKKHHPLITSLLVLTHNILYHSMI